MFKYLYECTQYVQMDIHLRAQATTSYLPSFSDFSNSATKFLMNSSSSFLRVYCEHFRLPLHNSTTHDGFALPAAASGAACFGFEGPDEAQAANPPVIPIVPLCSVS